MEFSFLGYRLKPMRRAFLWCWGWLLFASSCTKDIEVELPAGQPMLVVEGRIETNLPPIVLLSRSSPFYASLYLDSVSKYFVSGARITVDDGTDSIVLTELLLDTAGIQVPVYVGLGMVGRIGNTYRLTVEVDGHVLKATTTIPNPAPLDSVWWEPIEGSDTLVRLLARYTDNALTTDFIRYFTKRNTEPFLPGLNSVFDDALISGQQLDFPLDRGIDRNNPDTFNDYGLFYRGDTITVKWCAIDKEHFQFWRTLEFELGGQGSPFASPVLIQTNIEGGLGIWGGYAPSYYTLVVPR